MGGRSFDCDWRVAPTFAQDDQLCGAKDKGASLRMTVGFRGEYFASSGIRQITTFADVT
jgi:hypothetical protein